jgi:hypothetical protein
MAQELTQAEQDNRRQIAVNTFNLTWELMLKQDRTPEENDRMLHAAHASRFHWGEVGIPVNLVRGEWQVSRVYAVLNRAEPSLYHARRCLAICEANGMGDFDLAYAYEAIARALAVDGKWEECARFVTLAREAGEKIAEKDDKDLFLGDMETIVLNNE